MRTYTFTGLSDYPLQIFGFNFSVDPKENGHFVAVIKAKSLRYAVNFIHYLFESRNIRFSFDISYSVLNPKGATSCRILRNCPR